MTDRELMQKALGYMESVGQMDMHPEEWAIAVSLRERLAQPEPAPGYCPHCKQYTIEEPLGTHWEGCEEVHPECKKTVMAEYKFQTYAAYKTDGEMKIGVVPETRPATREEKIVRPGVYEVPVEQEPRREWVGLEQSDMPDGEDPIYDDPRFIAGMVWAAKKLLEKNT